MLPANLNGLLAELGNANLSRRMLAMNQLADRIGQPAVRPVERMLRDRKSSAEQKAHGLWVLHRLGALKPESLSAAAHDADHLVRVHAMRVLSETVDWNSSHRGLVLGGLREADPYVRRAAADALAVHPHPDHIRPLLEARQRVPADDVQLLHVLRMALRNQLQSPTVFEKLDIASLNETDSRSLTDVALGIQSAGAGSLVLNHARKFSESRDGMIKYLRHAARFAPDAELDGIATLARDKFADDLDTQFALFKSVQDGLAQRGAKLTAGLRAWAAELADKLLASGDDSKSPWINIPLNEATDSPWFLQKRKSADGDEESVFLCSLPPDGEMLTGILRSRVFTLPAQLSFYLAGHDGFPDRPPGRKNLIRLRAAYSSEILMSAPPPRNDIAQRITWDLSAHAGKQGVLEIVDADTGTAYAWLAAGRFEPAVVPLPLTNPSQRNQRPLNAAELTHSVPLPELSPRFATLFNDQKGRNELRAAAAQTLLAIDAPKHVALVAGTLADTNQPGALRESLALMLAEQNSPVAREAVLDTLRAAPQRLQVKLALALAGNALGADALLALVEQQKLPPQVIVDRAVKEKLAAAKAPQFATRYETLTKGVAPVSVELQKLMDARRAGYASAATSAERGRAVFEKSCVVCHQLDGKGTVVGPQLDGVGNRGLERIIEDVLDPSRNVDPAFRPSLITLKDDTSLTALQRREEGEVFVFVDTLGKEITVPKKEIAERRESQLSLMPANFGDVLPKAELYDLMAFLLAHGAK